MSISAPKPELANELRYALDVMEENLATGFLKPEDRVVLFNTGSGNKYTDVFAKALNLSSLNSSS